MPRARQQRKTHSRKNGDTLQENVKFIICCNELESRSSEGFPYFDMPPGFFCALSAGWVVKLLVQINGMMVVSMVYAQDTNQFQKFAKFYILGHPQNLMFYNETFLKQEKQKIYKESSRCYPI